VVIKLSIDKAIAGNPPPRNTELTLTRTFWGISGEPERYLIMIVPPRP